MGVVNEWTRCVYIVYKADFTSRTPLDLPLMECRTNRGLRNWNQE